MKITLPLSAVMTAAVFSVCAAPAIAGTSMSNTDTAVIGHEAALDEHELGALYGRYTPSAGVELLFGFSQKVDIDGIQRWSQQWQLSLSDTGMKASTTPPTHLVIDNRVDGAVITHWQAVTVELMHTGSPLMQGLSARVQTQVLQGLR